MRVRVKPVGVDTAVNWEFQAWLGHAGCNTGKGPWLGINPLWVFVPSSRKHKDGLALQRWSTE